MAQKTSIPKGTRDFGPIEMARRNYIFDTIRTVFHLYGFSPIETPAVENLSTLMGKYGEEGDKLLFKILNSGNYLSKIDTAQIPSTPDAYISLTPRIAEKGLRYDLTVPFARFVVQHRNELHMPFKRYQIQPVWRADRPQKGRYREFYQCDADIVGSDSLLNEAELLHMLDDVYTRLGIRTIIKINNRKILSGIAEHIGFPDKITDITTAIDKIDKIGLESVQVELAERGLPDKAIQLLIPILTLQGSTEQRIDALSNILAESEVGMKGIDEIRTLLNSLSFSPLKSTVEFDISLARGLNYYTGTIIEVKAADVAIGSITGGGRYDNLTGVFGLPGLSGVGISFGADRIYDVLTQLDLFPPHTGVTTQVMFVNFGAEEALRALPMMHTLRQAGISCEIYPDPAKIKKQLGRADSLGIPYVAMAGETELANNSMMLKQMSTGTQQLLTPEQAILALKAGEGNQ